MELAADATSVYCFAPPESGCRSSTVRIELMKNDINDGRMEADEKKKNKALDQ